MIRVAAMSILLSQLFLVWVVLEPSGPTAIGFTFIGTPLLVVGCALGFWAFRRAPRVAAEPAKTSGERR